MGDVYDSERKKLISDFNEAKLQILRLHGLWSDCHHLSCSGKLIQLNWKLDRIYIELINDMWDEDKVKKSKEPKSFYQRILEINGDISKEGTGGNKFYKLLIEKEMILRELQNAAGKGGRKSEEDADVMD